MKKGKCETPSPPHRDKEWHEQRNPSAPRVQDQQDQDHANQLPPPLCKPRPNSFCCQRCWMVTLFINIPKPTEGYNLPW